ncbi:MAG: acyl carrier protein [Myxococcota bacterium]|nr:acyl carrier protein [Myxococcota bacterium]
MTEHSALRAEISALIIRELRLTEGMPEGDLSESLDSVQRLSLVVAIEDHYEIMFDEEDDTAVTTLDEVVQLVAARLASR